MENKKRDYPFLKESSIEDEASKLLKAFAKEKGNNIQAPIPVFDIIEYLGYDIDFRTDGIYQDENILGGLLISKKMVEINENLSNQEGRMNFTAAHETGHIVLHVPYYLDQTKTEGKEKTEIICRKNEGFEGSKKAPEEWQADKFAANLLMPSKMVKKAFFQIQSRPVNVRKKKLLEIFFPKSPIRKAYQLAENVLQKGNFSNVSRMAMLNRLIGLRLVNGLTYQKSTSTK